MADSTWKSSYIQTLKTCPKPNLWSPPLQPPNPADGISILPGTRDRNLGIVSHSFFSHPHVLWQSADVICSTFKTPRIQPGPTTSLATIWSKPPPVLTWSVAVNSSLGSLPLPLTLHPGGSCCSPVQILPCLPPHAEVLAKRTRPFVTQLPLVLPSPATTPIAHPASATRAPLSLKQSTHSPIWRMHLLSPLDCVLPKCLARPLLPHLL